MLSTLILAGAISAPVMSVKQAAERYGNLTEDYQMVNRSEWIIKFDPTGFGVKWKRAMWINRDLLVPLTLVFNELQLTGLIKELTVNQGCYAARPVRGTNRPSVHAYGLGCDFNHKKFSREFVQVWERWGFCWGGRWDKKDYMHFSFAWECR